MLSLHTSTAVDATTKAVARASKALTSTSTRLGTGYRVNSAMDDASGLQIATRLEAQSRGMTVAMRNTQNAISMLQTAEGGAASYLEVLMRMRDLAVAAADGSSTMEDKLAMQGEYDSLGVQLAAIQHGTTFGGKQLFMPGGPLDTGVDFQIGASATEVMQVDVQDELFLMLFRSKQASSVMGPAAGPADGSGLSRSLFSIFPDGHGTDLIDGANPYSVGHTGTVIERLDAAIQMTSAFRAGVGAAANRLDHAYNNLANMRTNADASRGRIMDTDFAQEAATQVAKQLLVQSGFSVLKQSSRMNQLVLSLIN